MSVTELAPSQAHTATQGGHAGGDDRADRQSRSDSQASVAVGSHSPQPAIVQAAPNAASPAAGDLTDGQGDSDTHPGDAVRQPLDPDHSSIDNHAPRSAVGVDLPVTRPTTDEATPIRRPSDGWLELRIWCEQLEDAMAARIAATNRAERGGVDPTVYATYLASLTAAEHVCELAMRRCYRRIAPPEIVAWQKAERGIGDKLTARLLGHLGHPRIATPHHWEGTGTNRILVADEPFRRSVSQLWQYCGVGDPARRKRKGMTADEAFALGNPTLKMLMRLHAEACVKAGSGTYRDVYDDARATYADRVHVDECIRCGPSGKPAQPASPWALGHQHAAALRKVAKEILRDLWKVA